MTNTSEEQSVSLEEAMRAQKALRAAAGSGEETFPLQAFVGMISDEIETLRAQGKTDEDIASLIYQSSSIKIKAADIAENYAPPEARLPEHP